MEIAYSELKPEQKRKAYAKKMVWFSGSALFDFMTEKGNVMFL